MPNPLLDPATERSETETVASLAERYLGRHQPADYRIVVRHGAIRLGTRRWLVEVGVEPAGKEVAADDFANRVVAANADLDRDYPRYIRLTAVVPARGELL